MSGLDNKNELITNLVGLRSGLSIISKTIDEIEEHNKKEKYYLGVIGGKNYVLSTLNTDMSPIKEYKDLNIEKQILIKKKDKISENHSRISELVSKKEELEAFDFYSYKKNVKKEEYKGFGSYLFFCLFISFFVFAILGGILSVALDYFVSEEKIQIIIAIALAVLLIAISLIIANLLVKSEIKEKLNKKKNEINNNIFQINKEIETLEKNIASDNAIIKKVEEKIAELEIIVQSEYKRLATEKYNERSKIKKEIELIIEEKEEYNKKYIVPLNKKIKAMYDSIIKIYDPIINVSDWKNLELIYYYIKSNRADSLKEALQLIDNQRNFDNLQKEIKLATTTLCNEISSSFNKLSEAVTASLDNLSTAVYKCTLALGEELMKHREILNDINDNTISVSRTIAASTNKQIEQTNSLISQIEVQNALIEKANISTEELLKDINRCLH